MQAIRSSTLRKTPRRFAGDFPEPPFDQIQPTRTGNRHCGQEIRNHQKQSMLARGEWRAGAKGDGKTAGFHISSLYSPVGWFSWGDAAKQFEQAQKNSSLLQVFVNTVLGETWTLLGEAPDWKTLYDRREEYNTGIIPRGGLFLTAGADVQ